jgi:hypothetical protein
MHASSTWLTSRIAFALSGSWAVGAIAGILFAVNPLTAPVAGQVSARNTGLLCLFLLLCTWLYLKYQMSHHRSFLLLSIAAFLMALLSKEQAYMFPGILFILAMTTSDQTSSVPPKNRSRKLIFLSFILLIIALCLFLSRYKIVIPLSAWEYGRYELNIYFAEYGLMLLGFAIFLLMIVVAALRFPSVTILIWYALVEAIIVSLGLLPSGKLSEGATYMTGSPFTLSAERLSTDLFVLISTLGLIAFSLRDALLSIASAYPWLIRALWIVSAALLLIPLVFTRNRTRVLVGLTSFLIALAPLRIRPVEFFEMNNLYLAMPVVAMAIALTLKLIANRSLVIATVITIGITIFWANNLIAAQSKLIMMGQFSRELHAIFQEELKITPGPLRVIVNLPDPFRSTAVDPILAHWMVFRIVQSAMKLGGYSDENVMFVENKAVQVFAAEYDTPCQYEARVLDGESIVITPYPSAADGLDCLSQLKLIDFTAQGNNEKTTLVASRNPQYWGSPLSDAEVYAFDGKILRRLIEAGGSP